MFFYLYMDNKAHISKSETTIPNTLSAAHPGTAHRPNWRQTPSFCITEGSQARGRQLCFIGIAECRVTSPLLDDLTEAMQMSVIRSAASSLDSRGTPASD